MGVLIEKKPNPAKELLSGYRTTLLRRNAIRSEIEESYDRATSCTVRLKPISVSGSAASYDRMADDVVRGMDARTRLEAQERKLTEELATALRLIEYAQYPERKTLLTLRYIRGMSWAEIENEMHYGKTQLHVIHGYALLDINRRLEHERNEP